MGLGNYLMSPKCSSLWGSILGDHGIWDLLWKGPLSDHNRVLGHAPLRRSTGTRRRASAITSQPAVDPRSARELLLMMYMRHDPVV